MVCVWCDVFCRFDVNRTVVLQPAKRTPPTTSRTKTPTHNELSYVQSQIHITKYINKALISKQPMKNTTRKRTQWSQSIIDSGQNQLKYTYQLQQSDKTHHTKHTTINRKATLTLNHPSLQNKTTGVVIHQHSRKLLKMDILMSETCWSHKKGNKIASDIKLVFHSSIITMMHGPINIRC